jgi:hypothetical protein
MATIKVWNGSTWSAPQYRASGAWKSYSPGGTDLKGEWTFTDDDEGWNLTDGGTWVPGELQIPASGTSEGIYVYSPYLTGFAPRDESYHASATVRCISMAQSGNVTSFRTVLYGEDALLGNSMGHDFTAAGQVFTYTYPSFVFVGMLGMNFQCYASYPGTGAKFAITDAWIRRTDGTPIGSEIPSFIPKFWNGSAWVAQNTP